MQYVLGCCHWRDFVLSVGPGCLIPRPETELLIDFAEEAIRMHPNLVNSPWADLGTGSGAIAVGLGRLMKEAGSPLKVRPRGFHCQGHLAACAALNVARCARAAGCLGRGFIPGGCELGKGKCGAEFSSTRSAGCGRQLVCFPEPLFPGDQEVAVAWVNTDWVTGDVAGAATGVHPWRTWLASSVA